VFDFVLHHHANMSLVLLLGCWLQSLLLRQRLASSLHRLLFLLHLLICLESFRVLLGNKVFILVIVFLLRPFLMLRFFQLHILGSLLRSVSLFGLICFKVLRLISLSGISMKLIYSLCVGGPSLRGV